MKVHTHGLGNGDFPREAIPGAAPHPETIEGWSAHRWVAGL
jgi:hypothetical protein